jgi:hypothetical protein
MSLIWNGVGFLHTSPTLPARLAYIILFRTQRSLADDCLSRVNTGRSGTDICKVNAVRLGRFPASELPAMNRYAFESSWVTFREEDESDRRRRHDRRASRGGDKGQWAHDDAGEEQQAIMLRMIAWLEGHVVGRK